MERQQVCFVLFLFFFFPLFASCVVDEMRSEASLHYWCLLCLGNAYMYVRVCVCACVCVCVCVCDTFEVECYLNCCKCNFFPQNRILIHVINH